MEAPDFGHLTFVFQTRKLMQLDWLNLTNDRSLTSSARFREAKWEIKQKGFWGTEPPIAVDRGLPSLAHRLRL